ncbi:MAG: ATPase, T2SS/T4P/T4SS family [Thermaerobacter sp.]|nr:ATPase, T2SS/T4P/T4SS family [Thermaerobacter sp.]
MQPWQYLPNPWRQALEDFPGQRSASLEEIRFRLDRPVCLYGAGWHDVLTHPGLPQVVTADQLEQIVSVLVDHSLYARADELRQGFLTLAGGHRVGIAGRAVVEGGRVVTVSRVSGLNMRIGRHIRGPAEALIELLRKRGLGGSWLLASPPRAGKTTLLRDLVFCLSNEARRVVVVDERSEVAGCGGTGIFGFDVGCHTDVLDAWPKPEGVETALRTLGPDIIAVDELGGEADLAAIIHARYSGVDVLATVHARSREDLFRRPAFAGVLRQGAFDAVVFLSSNPVPGTVDDVWAWSGAP